jgi:hypothetical protein
VIQTGVDVGEVVGVAVEVGVVLGIAVGGIREGVLVGVEAARLSRLQLDNATAQIRNRYGKRMDHPAA